MRLKLLFNQKGVGLLEMVVALGIATAVIVSLVSLSLYTVRTSLRNNLFLEGTKLANREVELVRGLRDITPVWKNEDTGAGFIDKIELCIRKSESDTNSCSMDPGNLENVIFDSTTEGTGPEAITRYFYITLPDPTTDELVRVNVVISWQIGGETQYAYNYTDLSNWRNR